MTAASAAGKYRVFLACLAVVLGTMPWHAARAVDAGSSEAFAAEPDGYRMDDYRTPPLPATLKGATVLDNNAAHALWLTRTAAFIDVYPHAPKPANLPAGTLWREPPHYSIETAVWLANVGFGVLSPETEAYFKRYLEQLSGGQKTKPLVFFCLKNCWMSWNAAKRALSYGYTHVYWYPEGSDGWQEIGEIPAQIKPEP